MGELAIIFLRLGLTAFGGPAAHIAMMRREFVEKRGWLTEQEFLDYLSASNLIPGPSSTELAIHIGGKRAGWRGLLLGGVCFILPAALLVGAIAWAYVRFGALPRVAGVLWAVKPMVVVVVAEALWKLGRAAVKTRWLAVVAVASLAMTALNLNPLLVLVAGGLLAAVTQLRNKGALRVVVFGWLPISAPAAAGAVGLWPIFWVFVKIGAVLFGSGYVLLAFLRADLVERHHWLTMQQLVDSVAVGQVTPGPVFTTATFIGYLLAGTRGAAVATVGIFIPAFVLVALSAPLLPRLRRSPLFAALLDGVNCASLALMAWVTWQLAMTAFISWWSLVIAAAGALALFRFRVNSSWLFLAAAGLGLWLGPGRA